MGEVPSKKRPVKKRGEEPRKYLTPSDLLRNMAARRETKVITPSQERRDLKEGILGPLKRMRTFESDKSADIREVARVPTVLDAAIAAEFEKIKARMRRLKKDD